MEDPAGSYNKRAKERKRSWRCQRRTSERTSFQHQHRPSLCPSPLPLNIRHRHWFSQSPHPNTPFKSSSFITGVLMGGNEGGGRGGERWSFFGARPIVQKSPTDPGSETNTPGGFTLHSYFGIQKSNTMDAIKPKNKSHGRRSRRFQISQDGDERRGWKENILSQTETPRHEHSHSFRLLNSTSLERS